MKKHRTKIIAFVVVLFAGYFLLRKEFSGISDIAPAADHSQDVCPVHKILLKLDTVIIAVRKNDPDSVYLAAQKQYFPMAQDTFWLLQWYQDDEHKHLTRSEVWYCPRCRDAKKKFALGQNL